MNSLFIARLPGCSYALSGDACELARFGRVEPWGLKAESCALSLPDYKAIKLSEFLEETRKSIRPPARSDQSWKVRKKEKSGRGKRESTVIFIECCLLDTKYLVSFSGGR